MKVNKTETVSMDNKTVLITGCAGFIGSFVCKKLLEDFPSVRVVGIDCLTDYYDVSLKESRLAFLSPFGDRFTFIKGDISDTDEVDKTFRTFDVNFVINLAAQAGVRYSIDNPDSYIKSNVIGFYNILEACRHHPVEHLVFASSSSVYGANTKTPFSVADKTDSPVSLYAATKKSNELFAHAYSKLYSIPATALRFFTVYGPMGRPDMAYFKFADLLAAGRPIELYNNGKMQRDFTYIDDTVRGIIKVLLRRPGENEAGAMFKAYNIGCGRPAELLHFTDVLEGCLIDEGVIKDRGKRIFKPMQPGDVVQTFADTAEFERAFDFKCAVPVEEGLSRFAKWYKEYRT